MEYKVFIFKEDSLVQIYRYDNISHSFSLLDLENQNSDLGFGVIIFSSIKFVTIPIELPPNLNFKQRENAISSILEDEPIFEDGDFVSSIPDPSDSGNMGVGIFPRSALIQLESSLKHYFIISILPVEALFGLFLRNGRFVINDNGSYLYLEVHNGMVFQSYWFDDLDLIKSLDIKDISYVEMSQFNWSKLLGGLPYILSNKSKRHNLEFCRQGLSLQNLRSLLRGMSHITNLVKHVALLVLILAIGNFVYVGITYAITAYHSQKIIGFSTSSEVEREVNLLQNQINQLEKDISQLSVLNYHNVFTTLASLSKISSIPLDSFTFEPPRVKISGTAKEYSPVENLKKDLMKEREVFCSVKLEDLKDTRNQKRFAFELSLCKG